LRPWVTVCDLSFGMRLLRPILATGAKGNPSPAPVLARPAERHYTRAR
jgi:hypothetical protein